MGGFQDYFQNFLENRAWILKILMVGSPVTASITYEGLTTFPLASLVTRVKSFAFPASVNVFTSIPQGIGWYQLFMWNLLNSFLIFSQKLHLLLTLYEQASREEKKTEQIHLKWFCYRKPSHYQVVIHSSNTHFIFQIKICWKSFQVMQCTNGVTGSFWSPTSIRNQGILKIEMYQWCYWVFSSPTSIWISHSRRSVIVRKWTIYGFAIRISNFDLCDLEK
jgi:hypothetical protein